jgi:hypothetical protein
MWPGADEISRISVAVLGALSTLATGYVVRTFLSSHKLAIDQLNNFYGVTFLPMTCPNATCKGIGARPLPPGNVPWRYLPDVNDPSRKSPGGCARFATGVPFNCERAALRGAGRKP